MLLQKVEIIMNHFFVVVVMLSITSIHAAHNQCPPNTYFNTMFKKCINCSTCPDNEIIRSPCGPYEDLSCGPFVEFNHFVVGEKHKQQYRKPDLHKPVIHHNLNKDYEKPRVNQPALVTTIDQDTTPWKTIALSLISIICTSVVLLLVSVIVVHFYKKRNSGYDKEVIYETNESGMTEVCYSTLALDYMQKTRPSSALWMYTPAYHKSQDPLLNQHSEPEVSAPFANSSDGAEECTEKEHCAASSCTQQHNMDSNVVDFGHQHYQYAVTNSPNITSSNNTNSRSQSICSCNNHVPDYVFFNLAQNEYLEK